MDLGSRDVAATVLDLANPDQGCTVIARTGRGSGPRVGPVGLTVTLPGGSLAGAGVEPRPASVDPAAGEQAVRVVELETADPPRCAASGPARSRRAR
jgi:hypothetical protein